MEMLKIMKSAPQETSILDDFYYFEKKQTTSSEARRPVRQQMGYQNEFEPKANYQQKGYSTKKKKQNESYEFFE